MMSSWSTAWTRRAAAATVGAGLAAALAACSGGGGGASPSLMRAERPVRVMAFPENHFKHHVNYTSQRGQEELAVLFGPESAHSRNLPAQVEQSIENTRAIFTIDQGYAYLVTYHESQVAATDPQMLEHKIHAIPWYYKLLRSGAIEISTPGSRIMVQVLDTPVGGVKERAYLRFEGANASTAKVKSLATGQERTLTANAANEGQYVNLHEDGSLSDPKPIKDDHDVDDFIEYADDRADEADLT